MNPEEWRRIKHIAGEALERPEAERASFVATSSGGDETLRQHVEALLRSTSAAADLYESPALAITGGRSAIVAAADASRSVIGSRIGPYRIIGELGHGGMGSVYLGERADGEFEHRVAVKLVGGFPSEPLLRRFREERRILASLNHPHIASLLDGGSTAEGFPYLTMEYVAGTPIDVYCETLHLSLRRRIELFQRVCEAVHYAHQRQIIHRDIKPSNILVTADGVPKLLDFGIAKIIEADDVQAGAQTGLRALTPESASPEQTRGEPLTPSSDVYALGVLLYRLLTGRSPYGEPASESALLRAICDESPEAPSAVVRRNRSGESIGRDLDLIVLKALRKEPARRYASAEELGADLTRYLSGRPVAARPDSRSYRLRTFVKRHRVAVTVGAVAMIAGMLAESLLTRTDRPAAQGRIPSVAVLPFKPLVPGQGDDSDLGVALAGAMINELGAMRSDLRPVNAAHYRNDDPLVVGRKLGADLVLDGAIRKTGERLVVTASLVRAADGITVWTDRFDTAWTDVFTVQDAIAEHITRSLAITQSREDRRRVARRRTADFAAYEAYLRGRYFWNLRTTEGLRKALGYFQQAIERDVRYAPAFAGLADTYALLGSVPSAVLPPREAGERAKQAALKAVELDDSLAEAQASLAFAIYSFDWDWVAGEEHFQRAIDLDPDYVTAHYWYSLYLGQVGRTDEALLEAQRALDLEPLSLVGTYEVGMTHYSARRFDLARQYSEKALEISPNFPLAARLLGKVDIAEGRYEEAVAQCRRQYDSAPDNSISTALLAHAYARAGETAKARELLDALVAEAAGGYVSPVNIAIGYVGLGDKDAAFEWLERGYAERSQGLTFLKNDVIFDPLRSDPRFTSLLRRVGLSP
jgi:serine/threonine protein kinase/tetratricopeptide (TPR) repeat protein